MFNKKTYKGLAALLVSAALVLITACGNNNSNNASSGASDAGKLSGEILVDGSSTVYPLTEAAAEEFNAVHRDVRIPVGVSGTGGGFKQFCAGDIALTNASREIKDSEKELCAENGVEFVELEVAYDGLSVVMSKENDFVDYLTVEELHAIFAGTSTAKTWADIREGWPDEEIVVYSPGADSGTFDYFSEAILGEDGIKNEGVTFSEDDNVLVVGVSGSEYAIGYFGFSYYEENKDKLKVVPIDGGNGAVTPTYETINTGTYTPLSRSLYVYVNKAELERPEVKEFTTFYLENIGDLAGEVGFVGMPAEKYEEQLAMIQ